MGGGEMGKSRHLTGETKVSRQLRLTETDNRSMALHELSSQRALQKVAATAAAKLLQSCPTLCDPKDGSPPGPAVPGILQARTLEWVAISSSNA